MNAIKRRDFVKGTLSASVATALYPRKSVAANNKVIMGAMRLGGRGRSIMDEPVDPTVALAHSVLAVRRAWASGVPDFTDWGAANVGPEPLIINDLNGCRLFYDFNVDFHNQTIGVVRASANKLVGSPVVPLQLGPHQWSVDKAKRSAVKAAEKLNLRVDASEPSLICYCYPKIGVRVDVRSRETGASSMLVDMGDLKPIDHFGADEEDRLSSYSFLDDVATSEADIRLRRWEAADADIKEIRRTAPEVLEHGSDEYHVANIKAKLVAEPSIDFVEPSSWNVIKYAPRCNAPEVFRLYAQREDGNCAVATAQMILDFYKYHFSQSEIRQAMLIPSVGVLGGYELLSNNGLTAQHDGAPTWLKAKKEIDANRPVGSSTYGHARACAGWKRDNIAPVGQLPKHWLKIYDPYVVSNDICSGGGVYWEDWSAIKHIGFTYIRHS